MEEEKNELIIEGLEEKKDEINIEKNENSKNTEKESENKQIVRINSFSEKCLVTL